MEDIYLVVIIDRNAIFEDSVHDWADQAAARIRELQERDGPYRYYIVPAKRLKGF